MQQQVAPATNSNFAARPTLGWKTIEKFPDAAQAHWQTVHSAYWYKIDWQYLCTSNAQQPIGILISHLNMAGKVYVNNGLLWQDHSLSEPLSRSWNTPHHWSLAADLIAAEQNTLWIYVQGTATQPPHVGHVIIGNSAEMETSFKLFFFEQRALLFISFIINAVIGSFYILAWLINRNEKGFLLIGSTLFFWVIYNALFLSQTSIIDSILFERFVSWIFSSYTCIKCIGLWRFAGLNFPRLEKSIAVLWLILSALAWLTPVNDLASALSLILAINLLLFISYNISYPVLIFKTKYLELYVLAAIQCLTVPIALHDAYYFFVQQPNFWSPYYAPMSALFIGMVLGLRLYRHSKQIASFNQELQKQIATALKQREHALNMQHQLELQNTRLQERMHLAHDLHDSLGSSLVRSMAIVDQSDKNLTNHQFLSMLKVLRDDLRQIIDSGSSYGDPPENPKIWGAAVRYRFLQIFDELDIQLEWQVPEYWRVQPTALECLTYLRVIEEALTNILKHSQAKQVKVLLYYDDAQRLVLCIEDNGKGFDVQSVFQSGMSIGLKSMQARVQKIGALLAVKSNTNGTYIEVKSNLHQSLSTTQIL